MSRPLINCDLGEWEPPALTAALMPHLDLANIACGGHAGSAESIERCLSLCALHDVQPGLHPGSPQNQGRGHIDLSPNEFLELLEEQWTFFKGFCPSPHHIKLHGSLYHLSETDPRIRASYIRFLEEKSLTCLCLADGKVVAALKELNHPYLAEAFLDRNYHSDGSLVPRTSPNAILSDETALQTRITTRTIRTIDSLTLSPQIDTFCIHSDSPNALEIAKLAKPSKP